jgi:hypothetical protein
MQDYLSDDDFMEMFASLPDDEPGNPAPAMQSEPDSAISAHDCTGPPRFAYSNDGKLVADPGMDPQILQEKLLHISGGSSPEEGQALLRQLLDVCGLSAASSDIDDVNGVASQLYHMSPADPLEACTMVQLLGSHHLSMKYMRDAHKLSSFNSGEKKAALAVRFTNAYSKQLDALNKYRRGNTQNIQVNHNHVHMEGDSQAIIGDVKGA